MCLLQLDSKAEVNSYQVGGFNTASGMCLLQRKNKASLKEKAFSIRFQYRKRYVSAATLVIENEYGFILSFNTASGMCLLQQDGSVIDIPTSGKFQYRKRYVSAAT